MKKTIAILSSITMLASTAFADTTNVGVKISRGNLDASGTQTITETNVNGVHAGSSKDASFTYGSIFVEREMVRDAFNFSVGLDYTPASAEVDTLKGNNVTNAKIEISNAFTLYVQPKKVLANGIGIFAKIGYTRADLDVKNITTAAGASYNSSNTVTSASDTLEGPMFGLGVEKNLANGAFVRLEASYTNFDKVSGTSSNGTKISADSDLTSASLSIGKKF